MSKATVTSTLEAARETLALGIYPVPIMPCTKKPPMRGWQNLRLTVDNLTEHFSNGNGLGWLLGIKPRPIADVDLDCAEALAVRPRIKGPETGRIFGRTSKPSSHFLYELNDEFEMVQFKNPCEKDKKKAMLVELRGHGGQTVVPPSMHVSGEPITWESEGELGKPTLTELRVWASKLASAALLVRYWPKGHETRQALAGMLSQAGWSQEETEEFVCAILYVTQPDNREGRADVRNTYVRRERNEEFSGRPTLERMLGENGKLIVSTVVEWFGLDLVRDVASEAATTERESASTKLVNLARDRAVLFHSGDNCFATLAVREHYETHALNSRGFRRWLTKIFFERCGKATSGEAIKSAITTLEGFARFECEERDVFVRVAPHDGKVYLDLCDESWRVVEVGRQSWCVIESKDCPVRFRHAHGMVALPTPEHGGRMTELRPFVNLASDDDFILAASWLVGALHPSGPYPLLILHGEQGSAKSTTATVLRNLVDPNLAPRRTAPREARDLMIAANNGFVCSFDNLSSLPDWLSDVFCRLSTGGGFGTRSLYTDDEEIIFEAKRPVILNGIEELATRGDLLDRSVVIYLPRIRDEKRRDEAEFWAAFEVVRPRLLGALLDAISAALRNANSVKLPSPPRMADFARWVTAAEPSLGWRGGDFLRVYRANRDAANELPLETPVADAVRKLKLPWSGTATELLAAVDPLVDERTRHLKSWPTTGQSLSNELRRVVPNLRQAGISVEFGRDKSRRRRRVIHITPENGGNPSSAPSEPANCNVLGDHNSDATPDASSNVSSSSSDVSDAVDTSDDEKHHLVDTDLTCARCGNVEGNLAAARYHCLKLCPERGKGGKAVEDKSR